jgi:5-dehydro-2-deoxygluconokinase
MVKPWDVLALGRLGLDLYALEAGPKAETRAFGAFIGGNPLNVAVGAVRLGLKAGLVSAVGDDAVGEFVLARLAREGVDTRFVFLKAGHRTPAVVLFREGGTYPLTFYREAAADWALGLGDVAQVPVEETRALFVSGTALAREPSRSAAFALAERAKAQGVPVYLDLDFRPGQWHDPGAYGVVLRSFLPLVRVAIGGEGEVRALRLRSVQIRAHQATEPLVEGDLEGAVAEALGRGLEALVVKGGERGAGAFFPDGKRVWVEAFPVEVLTPLGAGDAFAAGLLWARLQGRPWEEALLVGNACGAIVASRLGCGEFSPTKEELVAFLRERGFHVD